jgi:branched-chain amino acid transport system substrate-binding protein
MAAQAATTITSQRPDFVVGGYCSGATIPALQEFYDNNLVMLISAANSTRITDLGLNQTFMINSPGSHAIESLITLMRSLSVRRVAVIHQGDDYTQNLSDLCNQKLPPAGFQIVSTEVMEKGAPDISAIVTSIRNSGAEFIYWCGYFADGGNAIRQLRAGAYTGYIACGDGSASEELIPACGPAGEGVFVTSPPNPRFAEGGQAFMAAYQAKYNQSPDAYAPLAYDTIWVLKTAIEQAGTTETAKVRDAVQNIRYQGLSGMISFAPNRELATSNFIIIQIKNGEYILYNP